MNMKFGHDIPRVVRYTAMTFPACSSGFIRHFMDHYTLQRPKAVSAHL